MKGFRRWTVGVWAKFDEMLGQVENHEALVSQALIEMRSSLAKANGQLARVDRDCRALEKELGDVRDDARRWRERARTERSEDSAMECLRRYRSKQKEADKLAMRFSEQTTMRDRVSQTVHSLAQRYLELHSKQRLLSTRQAAARASEAVQVDCGGSAEVEDVFTRWETRLAEREFQPGVDTAIRDEFSQAYDEQEERESLVEELRELRAEASS